MGWAVWGAHSWRRGRGGRWVGVVHFRAIPRKPEAGRSVHRYKLEEGRGEQADNQQG